MTYAVVYASATGNTKLLAEEIRKGLEEEECICFGTAEEAETAAEADIIFAGFWTDKGNCSGELGSSWRNCMAGKSSCSEQPGLEEHRVTLTRYWKG